MPFDPLLERALIAAIALALSVPFGMVLARIFGVRWLSRFAHRRMSDIAAKLNRESRNPYSIAMRGLVVLSTSVALAWLLGKALTLVIHLSHEHAMALTVLLLAALLNMGGIAFSLFTMARHAQQHAWPSVERALKALAPGAYAADGHGKLRVGVLLSAQLVQHRIIASILAFMLAGFEGVLIYRAVHLCAVHAPSQLPAWHAFGLIISWVFAPLRAVSYAVFALIGVLAGLCVPGVAPLRALRAIAHPVSYLAAMLQVSFGGNYALYGKNFQDDWRGRGTAKLEAIHARRSAWWLLAVSAIVVLGIASLHLLHS